MLIDRAGQYSTASVTRYGGASIAEALLFTSQLSTTAFQQITDYLLDRYGIQYSYYTTSSINTICGITTGTPKPCITTDGTVGMTGNLNLNFNKVIGLSNPTNATDAANKTYVDNSYVGLFGQLIGPMTTSTSGSSQQVQKTYTITSTAFTSLTVANLHPLMIIYNQSGTNYTDSFYGSIRSMSLSGTTLTLNYNITRVDIMVLQYKLYYAVVLGENNL